MSIDIKKLTDLLKSMDKTTRGDCHETSVFIGEVNGKPVRLAVMQNEEAEEEHDYEGTRPENACVNL